MTKIYAIVKKSALPELKDFFHPNYGHHWIDLDGENVLLLGSFSTHSGEVMFADHPAVELLPDMQFEGNVEIKVEHQALVKSLQPEGKTVLHVARAAGKIHPLMKLRSWE